MYWEGRIDRWADVTKGDVGMVEVEERLETRLQQLLRTEVTMLLCSLVLSGLCLVWSGRVWVEEVGLYCNSH